MFYSESAALTTIQTIVATATTKHKREYELFVGNRERLNAGEYKATITVRFTLECLDAEALTKEFMKLFIQGDEIVFLRSYPAILQEKNMRVLDFILEATISLEN